MNYKTQHKFYCGVDLHARSMFVHIVDHNSKTVFVEEPDTNRWWLRAFCSTAHTEAASPATRRRSRLRSGTQRREGAHAFSPKPPAASGDGRLGGKSMWKTKGREEGARTGDEISCFGDSNQRGLTSGGS